MLNEWVHDPFFPGDKREMKLPKEKGKGNIIDSLEIGSDQRI